MAAKRSSEQGTPASKRQHHENEATKLTIQVFVSFPDAEFPDVVFDVGAESLVADAIQAAADEWDTDAGFLELSFCGSVIPSSSLLMSHGVEAGSQLTASLLQVFGHKWFTDDGKRKKLRKHLSKIGEQRLSLDTPTFATDGCFQFDMAWIPAGVEEVSFVNPHPSITSAEFSEPDYDELDDGGFPVSKVDLTGLRSIRIIDDHFFDECSSISELDISCLSNVTEIGDCFLSSCSSLTTLDMGSLSNVTTIGTCFLAGCSSLSSLDMSGLNNVTTIDEYFLAGCSSLSSLDMRSLKKVTEISHSFLENCSSLSTLDLDFDNLTTIGNAFLESCTSLKKVDLTSFSNVTEISSPMLEWCTSLCEVHVTSLESINFSPRTLRGCSRIWVGGERASSKIIKEAIAKWVEVGEEVSLSEELSEN